jgi:hypothetical protein
MKKLFLIALGVFGVGFGAAESVQADPVHIGFAFFLASRSLPASVYRSHPVYP